MILNKRKESILIAFIFALIDSFLVLYIINHFNRNLSLDQRYLSYMFYRISEDCTGCGKCVDICPLASTTLILENGKYHIVPEECCDCGNCKPECEVNAIEFWVEPNE